MGVGVSSVRCEASGVEVFCARLERVGSGDGKTSEAPTSGETSEVWVVKGAGVHAESRTKIVIRKRIRFIG